MTAVLQRVSRCVRCGFQQLPALPGQAWLSQKVSPFLLGGNSNKLLTSTLTGLSKPSHTLTSLHGQGHLPVQGQGQGHLLQPSPHTSIPVRGRVEIYYQPSAWKRVNKHGIHRKLQTQGGIEVLWRRFLKGRYSLAPYERLLTLPTYNGQILPDHHLKINQHLVNKDLLQHFPKGFQKRYKNTRQLRKKH